MVSQMLSYFFVQKIIQTIQTKETEGIKINSVGEELHVDFKWRKDYLSDCVIVAR